MLVISVRLPLDCETGLDRTATLADRRNGAYRPTVRQGEQLHFDPRSVQNCLCVARRRAVGPAAGDAGLWTRPGAGLMSGNMWSNRREKFQWENKQVVAAATLPTYYLLLRYSTLPYLIHSSRCLPGH